VISDAARAETRSKTVTWHDPAISAQALSAMSGLEFLRAIRDHKLPPPPIAELLGMRMEEIEPGRVVFVCETHESFYNPLGIVHGGIACTLADTVAGCAVQTTLSRGVTFTSIDLNVSYLRPVTTASGLLRATGQIVKPGRRVAYSTAEIVDQSGKLVATATSSCLVIDAPARLTPGDGQV
jgi:uncharacterized protein (TIGR00369 family)